MKKKKKSGGGGGGGGGGVGIGPLSLRPGSLPPPSGIAGAPVAGRSHRALSPCIYICIYIHVCVCVCACVCVCL